MPNGAVGSDEFLRWAGDVAFRVARSILADDFLAEDVAQETLLEVSRRVSELKPAGASAWICTVARNKAIDTIRRRRRENSAGDPEFFDGLPEPRDDLAVLISDLTFEAIVVTVLPERLQEIARLRYQEDLSARAIAERTGRTAGTVRNNLGEIRALVRAALGVELPQ